MWQDVEFVDQLKVVNLMILSQILFDQSLNIYFLGNKLFKCLICEGEKGEFEQKSIEIVDESVLNDNNISQQVVGLLDYSDLCWICKNDENRIKWDNKLYE